MSIKIKYLNKNITPCVKKDGGDWIDLRASSIKQFDGVNWVNVCMNQDTSFCYAKGDFFLVGLGVAMEFPEGYEGYVIPRSSTFKNYGIIQTNSCGLIDESYCGDKDEWFFPAYALRDGEMHFDDRICQFRIQKKMQGIDMEVVEMLDNNNRGGHGSTGVK